jgi:hypothetical protein
MLQKTHLTAGSSYECQYDYPTWDGQDGEFVCTADKNGHGICGGDGSSALVLPTSQNRDKGFAGYLVGILSFVKSSPGSDSCERHTGVNYFIRVAKYAYWIASVMGVSGSELLATSGRSRPDYDDYDDIGYSSSMKSFDDALLPIMLCLSALAVIVFNN